MSAKCVKEGTRIYTAFFFKNNGMFPYFGLDGEARRDFLLDKLKSEVKDIEFIGGDLIWDMDDLVKVEERDDIDGILVYLMTGTIWPMPLWGLRKDYDSSPFRKKPMILATDLLSGFYPLLSFCEFAKRERLPVVPVQCADSDFENLKKALHLIEVIHSMNRSKILLVGMAGIPEELKGFGVEDIIAGDPMVYWRCDAEQYRKTVKEVFGPEIIYMGDKEFKEKYFDEISEEEAENVAQEWEKGATRTQTRGRDWNVAGARIYLAAKKAMEDMGIDAIAVDCRTAPRGDAIEITIKERGIERMAWPQEKLFMEVLKQIGSLPTFPCATNTQLNDDGFTSVGEGDLDAALTHLLMRYLTEKSGFLSDPVVDLLNNHIIYAHCCPIRKWEGVDGPSQPYELRMNCAACGVTFRTQIPMNEIVTTLRINALEKKLTIHQAKTIGTIDKLDEHPGSKEGKMSFEEKGCLNKFVAEIPDSKKLIENWNPSIFSWHRSTFVGDYRKEVLDLATLLGLEINEEDR